MGEAGFEPARPQPHAPKACASTIPPLPRNFNGTSRPPPNPLDSGFRRSVDGYVQFPQWMSGRCLNPLQFPLGHQGGGLCDVRHLPCVQRFQDGGVALSAERYAEAVGAAGVDAGGDALLIVYEHLDDALVDVDAQA